jgi:hypothetical protein
VAEQFWNNQINYFQEKRTKTSLGQGKKKKRKKPPGGNENECQNCHSPVYRSQMLNDTFPWEPGWGRQERVATFSSKNMVHVVEFEFQINECILFIEVSEM